MFQRTALNLSSKSSLLKRLSGKQLITNYIIRNFSATSKGLDREAEAAEAYPMRIKYQPEILQAFEVRIILQLFI